MTTTVLVATMSHLSDAQTYMELGMMKEANKHINFAKKILIQYTDKSEYIVTDELDKLWENFNK